MSKDWRDKSYFDVALIAGSTACMITGKSLSAGHPISQSFAHGLFVGGGIILDAAAYEAGQEKRLLTRRESIRRASQLHEDNLQTATAAQLISRRPPSAGDVDTERKISRELGTAATRRLAKAGLSPHQDQLLRAREAACEEAVLSDPAARRKAGTEKVLELSRRRASNALRTKGPKVR